MVITNGFMYIAFLMCLAGILLALEKYTKWKIFNVVPPLVWIYVLNMIFCTLGLYHSKEVSAAYKALKNNLLYAMIFVMLLRCDFRKLAKLGGRMVAIFLGCSLTLFVGFIVGYPIFKGSLGSDTWGAVAALYASWVGGSANMAAMQAALPVDAGAYSCALALDTVCYSVWIALLLLMVRYASKWNNAVKADTSKLQAVADAAAAEVAKEKKQAGGADWIFLIGLSLIVSAISQYVGASLNGALRDVGLAMFDKGSMTTLFVTVLGLVCAMTPLGKVPAVEELSSVYLYAVVSLLARQQQEGGLRRNLPDFVQVAHKCGNLAGVEHDAGIFFGKRPYLLAVLTTEQPASYVGRETIGMVSLLCARAFGLLG